MPLARTKAISRNTQSNTCSANSRTIHDWREQVSIEFPVLPYAGTSGWSGTDTSKARAITSDTSGDTADRQAAVIRLLYWYAGQGLTWRELADCMGWHHGQASGVLSVLHKEGKIARLLETRARCRVYVLEEYVSGRETDSQGRKPKPCSNCGHVD